MGVLISSISKGFNVDLFSYLFGSILVISKMDLILSIILSIIVILIICIFYNSLFAITYDEEFANVLGINSKFINYLISTLTSITVVLGIRIVGTMLISSMIIFPTVTALQVSNSFNSTILISSIVSIISVIMGTFISYIFNLPTGATIVIINGMFFLLFFLIRKLKKIIIKINQNKEKDKMLKYIDNKDIFKECGIKKNKTEKHLTKYIKGRRGTIDCRGNFYKS